MGLIALGTDGVLAPVPKLAPDTIHRDRLTAWLAGHADVPVRLIVAPTGSGKTTALVHYAARSTRRVAFARMSRAGEPRAVLAVLAEGLGMAAPHETAEFLRDLADAGRCEVLIDDVETANEACLELLRSLVMDAPENVTFAYASRAHDVLDTARLVSLGLATVMNADRLAFTVDECAAFARAAGARVADPRDLERLVTETEGWALGMCGAVRHAASAGHVLTEAFARWQADDPRFIPWFLDTSLAYEDRAVAEAARAALRGEQVGDPALELLERRGLFVRWTEAGYRSYRAMSRASESTRADSEPEPEPEPFAVRLFGGIDVSRDGVRVKWIRRRDAQLFAYLALQPHGRATRAEIVEAFWPESHPQLAGQSLRTACSTMRRALAEVTGTAGLARYVTVGDTIALDLDLFKVDARRVAAHLIDAREAADRGSGDASAGHSAAALRLARAPFLNADVPPALAGIARQLEDGLGEARVLVEGFTAALRVG